MRTVLEHTYLNTNGVRLHVVQAGPEDGKPVILLHGFPEFWYSWRYQVDALVNAGYRLWLPDQRGYNLSDKPEDVSAYNLDELVQDIIGLIDQSGHERVILGGHDWGGAVAWRLAQKHPEQLEKLIIFNSPHPAVMKKAVQNDPRQRARSLYGVFFQIPTLPEAMLRLGNWETLASAAFRTSHAFTDEDIRFYKEAWSQPDAMTSMLNWYRAVAQSPPQKLPSPRITVPTLMIWGMQDPYLESDLAQPSIDLCDDGRLILLEDISHWVQHEAAAEVNHHLLEWLGSYRSVSTPTK